MKTNIFHLIFLIFLNESYRVNALECYSCLSTKPNTTGCDDKFNVNGTLISTHSATTTNATCTKMVGKLTDGNKFTLRNASLTGCPQGLESSAIVGNSTTVQIADLKIYCCHKHLCNRALSQSDSLSNTLISIVFAAVAAAMALSNTSSASSTCESHVLTPVHHTGTKSEWMEAIEQQHLERSSLNRLIINYLITEGFKEAAEIFAQEAGITLNNVDLTSVDERLKIREAIENGKIQDAICLINKKAPELLDQNKQLAFHLKQQHLIELIRLNLIDEALTYAQTHLAEFAEDEIKMRQELEKTMALLVFDKPLESPYGYLMETSHRQIIANQINNALLVHQNQQSESDLSMLVKMVNYIEDKLDKKSLRYPKLIDIPTGKLEDS
ncbi:unnamed protein product [Rotaria socialis]|uniref:CTLH domain-containing protein n=1 Tax=Rotaria socialis TaxID=392032 RepID=A0A820U2Q7_9BILA|nr:unnamed protein product [Rotaria socialis]